MRIPYVLALAAVLLSVLALSGALGAESLFKKTPVVRPAQPTAQTQNVVLFTRTAKPDFLVGRPDTDRVQLQDGRKLKVGDVRRLTAMTRKLRAAKPGSRMPQALKLKPAPTGTPVRNADDITQALERPDSATIQLPSGKTMTVGLLKLVREDVERRLGRSLTAQPTRPDLSGTAVKVQAGSDWKSILQRPDSTVLESPGGNRITVGELKQVLADSGSASTPPIPARFKP
jgi:hypothetical protein